MQDVPYGGFTAAPISRVEPVPVSSRAMYPDLA